MGEPHLHCVAVAAIRVRGLRNGLGFGDTELGGRFSDRCGLVGVLRIDVLPEGDEILDFGFLRRKCRTGMCAL